MELYDLALRKHVVLMEAIKAAYCPGFQQMLNVVQSGRIGQVKDVEASFTRIANIHSRERTDPMYGGAFLEYGMKCTHAYHKNTWNRLSVSHI